MLKGRKNATGMTPYMLRLVLRIMLYLPCCVAVWHTAGGACCLLWAI